MLLAKLEVEGRSRQEQRIRERRKETEKDSEELRGSLRNEKRKSIRMSLGQRAFEACLSHPPLLYSLSTPVRFLQLRARSQNLLPSATSNGTCQEKGEGCLCTRAGEGAQAWQSDPCLPNTSQRAR